MELSLAKAWKAPSSPSILDRESGVLRFLSMLLCSLWM